MREEQDSKAQEALTITLSRSMVIVSTCPHYAASTCYMEAYHMPEVTFRFGRQTIKYDRLRKSRRTMCVLLRVLRLGLFICMLPKVTVMLTNNIKLDNDVMIIR